MKYIRTKNGVIYKVIKEYKDSFELESSFDKSMGCQTFMPKSFLGGFFDYKSADTIEELCDAAIRFEDGRLPLVFNLRYGDEFIRPAYKIIVNRYKSNVYLGIYVNRGLAYVAKVNKKGKLELL